MSNCNFGAYLGIESKAQCDRVSTVNSRGTTSAKSIVIDLAVSLYPLPPPTLRMMGKFSVIPGTDRPTLAFGVEGPGRASKWHVSSPPGLLVIPASELRLTPR